MSGQAPEVSGQAPEVSGQAPEVSGQALVVELVDTQDLKSCDQQRSCGFNSRLGHLIYNQLERLTSVGLFDF